ncbi:hypothetical protein O2K51_02480 [Apibacter raozihei]|uniref:hypothetical protein n=1 Tax=Apibacter raozihei TaxID=2500547 RepID=UPI000FE422B9|nr:hypothetical protein [Apibacter raozihei]
MKFILVLIFFVSSYNFQVKAQIFTLKDSITIDIPDSYILLQSDAFNSLYFASYQNNSLIKITQDFKKYTFENFNPTKKLFIVNSLFVVMWDKVNKTLEFFDDKLNLTQDPVKILPDQIINSQLLYVQDNKNLTYFDEFNSGSFIQYDYRNDKNLVFSNSLTGKILKDFQLKDIYATKYSRYLLAKKISKQDSLNNFRIIRQNNMNGEVQYFDIPDLNYYFWNENKFEWIDKNYFYSYDFENEPKKIQLPAKAENYYILNDQLFLWKSKVMYLYTLKSEI